MKEEELEEVRKKFFAQVQEEYDNFRYGQKSGGIERVYTNSLKITFYKEVYRYLIRVQTALFNGSSMNTRAGRHRVL